MWVKDLDSVQRLEFIVDKCEIHINLGEKDEAKLLVKIG